MVQVENVEKIRKLPKRRREKKWNFPFFPLPFFALKSNLTSYLWLKAAQKRERKKKSWKRMKGEREKRMARIPCKFHGLNYHMLHVTHIHQLLQWYEIRCDRFFVFFFVLISTIWGMKKKSLLPLLFFHLLPNMPAVARSTIFTA